MRTLPSPIINAWQQGGPFIGDDAAPHGRVTVEKTWKLHTTTSGGDSTRWPFRWWQREDNSQVETEIPNIKTIEMDRTLDADAASCTITLYNQWMDSNVSAGGIELGNPGYFTFNRGHRDAQARWGQSANEWANVLIPNALLRTYQGYGGRDKTIGNALLDGNIVLTGVWLIDEVRLGTDGIITLQCRDMAKLLIEQIIIPPLYPKSLYPLSFYRWVKTQVTNPAVPVYDFTDPVESGPGNEGPKYITDIAISADGEGYWVVGTDGGVFSFGVPFYGSRGAVTDTDSMVSIAADPLNRGYWTLSEDGGVFTFGEVLFYGSGAGGGTPNYRRIEAHPSGKGYWTVRKDGTVEAFGVAVHHGDNPPTAFDIVDICVTASGNGYWLMSLNGEVYTYGDALYYGNAPSSLDISMGMAATPHGDGYWIVSHNGLVTSHGAAKQLSLNGDPYIGHLNDPMVGVAAMPTGNGILLVGGDGGVFSFGDAPFWGSLPKGFSYESITDGNYKDYVEIVRDLLMWSGWFLFGSDGVYGNTESTGAYSDDSLPNDLFDKRPIIDGINAIKEIVGYHFYIDDEGAARFETPNWFKYGNFDEEGNHLDSLFVIDERLQISDYAIQYNDRNAKSRITVSSDDPNAGFDTTVTSTIDLSLNPFIASILRGMIRPGIWINGYFTKKAEQERMLERIVSHIEYSLRTGTLECVANPAIQINDQVRIYERVTAETYIHYIRGVSSHMDLDNGKYTMTLQTNWLGEDFVAVEDFRTG